MAEAYRNVFVSGYYRPRLTLVPMEGRLLDLHARLAASSPMVGRAHLAYLRLIGRASMTALTVILFAWAALQLTAIYRGAELRGEVGYDFGLYTDIGRHFLQTGE